MARCESRARPTHHGDAVMSALAPVETANGQQNTYEFYPEPDIGYTQKDFDWMAAHIQDGIMCGYAVMRLIGNTRITVTTIGSSN